MAEIKRISKKAALSCFWRQYPILAYFNYEKQQAGPFCYAMIPALKELYGNDKEKLREALIRHNAFFNTSPPFVPFIQGVVASMEEEYAADQNGSFDPASINNVKAALMGPLAGIGDSLFWGTFRIIGVGIGAAMCIEGNPLGPIIYALINIIPATIVRIYGWKFGYNGGRELLSSVASSGLMDKVTEACKIMGLVVVGYMIASMVTVTCPLVLNFNGIETSIQADILDAIMPNILPLGITFACYLALQKGVKSNTLIWVLLIAGVLLHIVGLL